MNILGLLAEVNEDLPDARAAAGVIKAIDELLQNLNEVELTYKVRAADLTVRTSYIDSEFASLYAGLPLYQKSHSHP